MSVAERKQRELLRRETLMIEAAQEILLAKGYAGLTMEGLAAATSYSKGTVYQHFQNKEDVLLKIALQAAERRVELFRFASAYPGRARERFVAIAVADRVFHARNPQQAEAEQIVQAAVKGRLEEGADQPLHVLETLCMETVSQIVRSAVEEGDLPPEAGQHAETLSFGAWALAVGVYTLGQGRFSLTQLGVEDTQAAHQQVMNYLLDGVGWHPLSTAHDYTETLAKAERYLLDRLESAPPR